MPDEEHYSNAFQNVLPIGTELYSVRRARVPEDDTYKGDPPPPRPKGTHAPMQETDIQTGHYDMTKVKTGHLRESRRPEVKTSRRMD